MNGRQRGTLRLIFEDPVRSDIRWKSVENLIEALGGQIDTHRSGSRVGAILNDVVAVFHRPHPEKVTDKGAVKSVRRFLESAGINPDEV